MGTKELKSPTQKPCKNLPTTKNYGAGINTIMPANIASPSVIKNECLV
jgi:hypothetical protein